MKLPDIFITRMKDELLSSGIKEEGFFESFDEEPLKGIRFNKSKTREDIRIKIMDKIGNGFPVTAVPWCDCGYYTDSESSGNSPYYHAGVIYPQEPSAMLPAQVLSARPGDLVIDLCAAPGGKACRVAEDLKGEGVLIANEISAQRAKALLRNIERMGIGNAVILNEDPVNMRDTLKNTADKIIVDAPCSGEGMFRRDPSAVRSWEKYGPDQCAALQDSILDSADIMLKDGGELVYSTCTFGIKEDEKRITAFISRHPEYHVVPHPEILGVTHAGPDSILPGSMRIWPHLSPGDGHFCVHLKKGSSVEASPIDPVLQRESRPTKSSKQTEAVFSFMREILTDEAFERFKDKSERLFFKGEHVMIPIISDRRLGKLNVIKNGLYLGELKKKGQDLVLNPSNSLALSLRKEDIKDTALVSFEHDDTSLIKYLKGETLNTDVGIKGNVVISVDSFPLGFGKRGNDGMIKNLYPKAWRLL